MTEEDIVDADENGRAAAALYIQVQALSQDAVKRGYDHHMVAEVLMHGALSVLADKIEFQDVLTRFLAHYDIGELS